MASMFAKGKQHRGRVLRQQGEPDVIRGRDLAAQGVLVDVAHLEVLKEPAPPASLTGIRLPLFALGLQI